MSWKETMKEWGGGDVTFMSEDGEVLDFVICGDPILIEGKYKGKPQQRVGVPIVTEDGFSLFCTGKRLARKLSKFEDRFANTAFRVIRHGEENDVNARYPISVIEDKELTARLFKIKVKEYNQDVVDEAVEYATELMAG